MPTNLEIKAKLPNRERAIEIAEALPSSFSDELNQTDTYFIAPQGRLKLREINQTTTELIYYNRAEDSNERISKFEIYQTANSHKLKSILTDAFGVKAVVKKHRRLYLFNTTRIHIDEVEGLGDFIEFEVPIDSNIENAHQIIDFLISKFHLHTDIFIKGSYVDLILEQANAVGN